MLHCIFFINGNTVAEVSADTTAQVEDLCWVMVDAEVLLVSYFCLLPGDPNHTKEREEEEEVSSYLRVSTAKY